MAARTKGGKNFRAPDNNDFSDEESDDDYQSGGRHNSRTASRQSSVTGSKNVEMLIAEFGDDKDDDNEGDAKNARMLTIVFIAMVFVGLGNKVFQKLMTIPMRNYPNFLNLLTTFIYLPTSFGYIIPSIRSGWIPKEQAEMGKWPFFVMGFLDAIAGIMQVFAATYLPGPLLILLSQAAIPMSMIITRYLLKIKYSLFQYLGAIVVALGIITVLAPTLSGDGSILWASVMIFSTIPMALSSVYKEIALGETELDPIFLNGWICVFQFLFSLMMMVPASLTADPPVPVNELPQNLYNGLMCYGGKSSQTCDADDDNCTADDCYMSAPILVSVYLVFNQMYNLLIIFIIKYGSSNLLFMALTIMVPLGNFAFTLPFVPGHAPLHATDIVGLIVISGGLICYRFGNQLVKKYFNGECCGYQVVPDEDDNEDGLDNPLLKDSLYDEENNSDNDPAALLARNSGTSDKSNKKKGSAGRYSVSKVAKQRGSDDEDGVSLH